MYRDTRDLARIHDDSLVLEVPDEELEAAAGRTAHAAATFPSAPTVSVLILCCGNGHIAEPE